MPIVESILRDNVLQADGTRNVTERHTDHKGGVHDVTYRCPVGIDPQLVMEERAAKLGAQIDARDAAEVVARDFALPYTKFQFRQRYTLDEQKAIDDFNATFESNAQLTAEQKAEIRTALENFKASGGVYLNDPATISGVQMHEDLGLIAVGRAAEILNG